MVTAPSKKYWRLELKKQVKQNITSKHVMTLAVPRSATSGGGKPHLYFLAHNNCSMRYIILLYRWRWCTDGRFTFVFTPANGKHTFQVSTMFIVILVSSLLFAGAIGLLISDTIRRKKKK